jgi:drug/metabolite transporter (DMT)-like permease
MTSLLRSILETPAMAWGFVIAGCILFVVASMTLLVRKTHANDNRSASVYALLFALGMIALGVAHIRLNRAIEEAADRARAQDVKQQFRDSLKKLGPGGTIP